MFYFLRKSCLFLIYLWPGLIWKFAIYFLLCYCIRVPPSSSSSSHLILVKCSMQMGFYKFAKVLSFGNCKPHFRYYNCALLTCINITNIMWNILILFIFIHRLIILLVSFQSGIIRGESDDYLIEPVSESSVHGASGFIGQPHKLYKRSLVDSKNQRRYEAQKSGKFFFPWNEVFKKTCRDYSMMNSRWL